MPYTEVKERNGNRYFYRCQSLRAGPSFRKKRIYLGRDLGEEELEKMQRQADRTFRQRTWPTDDKSFFFYAATIVPYLNYAPLVGMAKIRKRLPDLMIDWYFTFYAEEGEHSGWIMSEDDQYLKSLRLFEDGKDLLALQKEWQTKVKKYYACVDELKKKGIRNLQRSFETFCKLYIDEFTPAIIIDACYMGHERLVRELISKYPQHKNDINYLLEPETRPFHHEERESLLKIALLIRDGKDYSDELKKHQENFFWIQNGYKYADPISIETFREMAIEASAVKDLEQRLAAVREYEQRRQRKVRAILARLTMTPKEKRFLLLSSKLAAWQDKRKKANLIADYWLSEMLKRIAARFNYDYVQLQHAQFPEVKDLFKGKKISKLALKKRMEYAMHVVDPQGKLELLHGEQALTLKKALVEHLDVSVTGEVRGTSGSMGIAQGIVRVVHSPREHFSEGDILVTGMTRPEYLPLMKKAAAIVTDEGGVTCHAAIVARELGVPCVIGTKNATKVLKDGDEVIVNGNHGVVRVLPQIFIS